VLALLGAGTAGCGHASSEAPVATPAMGSHPEAPPTTHVEAVAGPGAADPLAGTWWILTPTHPFFALRLSLVGTESPERLEGSWVSFDWRASSQAESLVRRSKAVRVSAQRTGPPESPERLVIEGPRPMLDENGVPNGQHGTWRIDLTPSQLPGETPRFQGRGVQTDPAGGEGVTVDLVREYRPFKP
jgi:hypothetical protein